MSSNISSNSDMHNQVSEVPDQQSYPDQESGTALEAPREPQAHSEDSLRPSTNDQLSSPVDPRGIEEPGGEQRESAAHRSPSSFMKLPPEMKKEIGDHLSRQDLGRLSLVNKDLYRQFNKAAHDSLNRSNKIEKGMRELLLRPKSSPGFLSEFNAQIENNSFQRPADQIRDLSQLFTGVIIGRITPDQRTQVWSQVLKHPIDQESLPLIGRLAIYSLPADKSSGIVNGLLDQIERQSSEGTLPIDIASHPLEVAVRLVTHMPPEEKQAAANRIRAMAQSQNLGRLTHLTIEYHLSNEGL